MHLLKHLFVHVEAIVVALDLAEHFCELLPIVFKSLVLLDDQVDDVQVEEERAEVVEDLCVLDLLERLGVGFELGVEEAVHLQQNVLGDRYDSSRSV